MEKMIERIAEEMAFGVKAVEETAAHTRIERAAGALEKPRGVRPGDIVEIAGYDERLFHVLHFARDQHQFRIALLTVLPLAAAFVLDPGRTRMYAEKHDRPAIVQLHARADRRDLGIHQ